MLLINLNAAVTDHDNLRAHFPYRKKKNRLLEFAFAIVAMMQLKGDFSLVLITRLTGLVPSVGFKTAAKVNVKSSQMVFAVP